MPRRRSGLPSAGIQRANRWAGISLRITRLLAPLLSDMVSHDFPCPGGYFHEDQGCRCAGFEVEGCVMDELDPPVPRAVSVHASRSSFFVECSAHQALSRASRSPPSLADIGTPGARVHSRYAAPLPWNDVQGRLDMVAEQVDDIRKFFHPASHPRKVTFSYWRGGGCPRSWRFQGRASPVFAARPLSMALRAISTTRGRGSSRSAAGMSPAGIPAISPATRSHHAWKAPRSDIRPLSY